MIKGLINKFATYRQRIEQVEEIVGEIVDQRSDILLSLNRDQMLLGRDAAGEVLTPDYLNDPYFDNPAQARAYADMKYMLEAKHNAMITNPTIYPDKGKDTPNLIVTGPFQGEMFIYTSKDSFTIGSTYVDAKDIEAKYNNLVFGIAPASAMFFYLNYIRPELMLKLWGK